MFLRRTGLPEEGEILLCTVTKIYHHSVFITLDEYSAIPGMIHISEIAPGRIRNIRDFVIEGKKVICKVLTVNKEKRQVDLSLRRVSETQKSAKNEQLKLEQKSEKIVEVVAKEMHLDAKDVYDKLSGAVFKKYYLLHDAFSDFVAGNFKLSDLKLDPKLQAKLEEIVRQRIKPQEVEIKGMLTLSSYASNGLDIIKDALQKAQEKSKDQTTIKYLGGGKYLVTTKAQDFKMAEKIMKTVTDTAISIMEKEKGTATFARAE